MRSIAANDHAEANDCVEPAGFGRFLPAQRKDRKSTRPNSSHSSNSYAVFCLKKKKVQDASAAAGVTWKLGGWNMDSSVVYGLNKMDFTIENTLNRSLGAASKTVFDAVGFSYDQLVFNFSGVRGVDVGLPTPLNVALGL